MIALRTAGIHHLTLRSTNLARSRAFYGSTLGLPIVIETPELFAALAGGAAIVVRGPDSQTPADDRFNPFRVGLDHVALGCSTEPELERVAEALTMAGVPSSGLKFDAVLQRRYVAFKDPDGIAWEFYMAPNVSLDVVNRYIDALQSGDFERVPFADDVSFESPMAPRISGRAAVLEVLRGMRPLIETLTVIDHLVDGEWVAVRFVLATPFGPIEVFDRCRVSNGLLADIRPYFDPRVITEAHSSVVTG